MSGGGGIEIQAIAWRFGAGCFAGPRCCMYRPAMGVVASVGRDRPVSYAAFHPDDH